MTATFNALATPVFQTADWQCSAATLAWMLDSVGRSTTQDDAVTLLTPTRISPELGLLDASGGGLVEVLHSLGYAAHNMAVGYDDVLGIAGSAPIGIGGGAFYHWVGVRGRDGDDLLLANPAPGYKGVGQSLSRGQFNGLGPFHAVVIDDVGTEASSTPVDLVGQLVGPNTNWIALGAAGFALLWALDLV